MSGVRVPHCHLCQGLVVMVAQKDADAALKLLKAERQRPKLIGEVVSGSGKSVLAG